MAGQAVAVEAVRMIANKFSYLVDARALGRMDLQVAIQQRQQGIAMHSQRIVEIPSLRLLHAAIHSPHRGTDDYLVLMFLCVNVAVYLLISCIIIFSKRGLSVLFLYALMALILTEWQR